MDLPKAVFVVCGNDYPDAAFTSEEAADRYRDEQNAADKRIHQFRQVFYHTHSIPLNPSGN